MRMRKSPLIRVLAPHRYGLEHYHSDSVAVYFYVISALSVLFHQLHVPDTAIAWAGTIASVALLVLAGIVAQPLRPWMTQIHFWIAAIGFAFYQLLAVAAYGEGATLGAVLREILALLFAYCGLLSILTLRSLRDGTIELEEIARQETLEEQVRTKAPKEVMQDRIVRERLAEARRVGKLLN